MVAVLYVFEWSTDWQVDGLVMCNKVCGDCVTGLTHVAEDVSDGEL